MNTPNRTLFVGLILLLATVPGFSQDANTQKTEKKTQTEAKEETSNGGLKKIVSRTPRDWDFDIHVDEEALERNIKLAIESAMKEVEGTLESIQVHIEPIEIDLGDLNIDVNPIKINIPNLNIDIEPIEVNMDHLNIDMDNNDDDHIERDDDEDHDHDKYKEKDKHKDKSDKKDKEKSKGLKKLN